MPYDAINDVEYYQEDIWPELDLAREVVIAKKWWGGGGDGLMHQVSGAALDKMYPYIAVAIVGAVLAYALLTGGVRWKP